MKKLAMTFAACAMVLTGLGAAGSAQAVPYPGAVPTKTTIISSRATIPSGARAEMHVRVQPISGTARVRGTLQMTCTHPIKGGGTFVRNGPVRSYVGPKGVLLSGPTLWVRRQWSCVVHFSGGTSVFAASGAGPRTVTVR